MNRGLAAVSGVRRGDEVVEGSSGPARGVDGLRSTARVALAVAAAVTLVAWSVGATPEDWSYGVFGVLTVAGVASRLVQARQQGQGAQLALVFVGAMVLLVDGTLAVWGAALVGLAGVLRGDGWTRVLVSLSSLTLAQSAAAWARLALVSAFDDLTVGTRSTGTFGVEPFGVTVALSVAVVLAATWATLRWVAAWLDRRSRTEAWRAQLEARWLRDLTLAAAAVVTAVLWAVYPPLVLLVLVITLAVLRTAGGGGDTTLTSAELGVATPSLLRVALTEELQRAEQFDRDVSVLLVDIDGLRRVNARFGYEAGDELVRRVAAVIRDAVREYDVVARIGDDAFAVVLPEAPREGALGLADRIRDDVRRLRISTDTGELTATVSIGVAAFPGDADGRDGLLTEAELAADYASIEGGDRVTSAAALPSGFRQAGDRAEALSGAAAAPTTEPLGPDRLVKATPEALADARPRTDRLLSAAIVAAAIASAVAVAVAPEPPAWTLVLLFVTLAAGAEWFAESIYARQNSSWAAVPLVALAVSGVAPLSVVLAGVAVGLLGGALRGVRVRQAAFNAALLVLSGLAAWAVAEPLLPISGDSLLAAAAVGVVAGAAFFVVDTWLVAAAVAVASRTSVFEVWQEDLAWLVPHQLGMGLLGGAMAYAQHSLGTGGTVLLVLPALALQLAQRQFTRRTRDNVVRLRNLNDDMTDANRRVLRVNERLTDALEQVNQGYLVTVESLAAAVDAKDSYTGSHIDRVEQYGKRLLEVLDPSLLEDEALLWGFRLHDVGKIGVPDRVLLKPGPLDDDEWAMMKRHPEIGAEIVAAAPFLQGARDVILHHHERWDGRGYPFGLAREAIPFSARLFTVVDAYDAMTSDRPYRDGMPIEKAVQELVRTQGTQFDPEMIEAFLQIPLEDLDAIRREVEHGRSGRSGSALIEMTEGYADLARDRTPSS